MSVSDYTKLVTSQHVDKPNFMNWLILHVNILDNLNILAKTVDSEFDIDNAVGAQLDILGVILGRKRTVSFQPSDNISPTLDDDNYRIVLKAAILSNQWDGTNEHLMDMWSSVFPDITMILVDNQDMTMDIYIIGLNSTLQRELINNGYIIPQPIGVAVNFVFPDNVIFGYDENNTLIQGYGTGHWFFK